MLKQMKEMADAAVTRQNKMFMEETLKNISAMCAERIAFYAGQSTKPDDGPIEAGDVLVGADGKEFKVDEVVEHTGDPGADGIIRHATFPAPTIGGAKDFPKPAKKGGKK
jgi:hypothetical protein